MTKLHSLSTTFLTFAGLSALLIIFVPSWLMYPNSLHGGIDGSFYTFTLSQLSDWSSHFDQFVFNPYQGSGTIFLTSNIWFNPGHLVFALHSSFGNVSILIFSYGIFLSELYLSVVFLARALRLPIIPSIISGQLICMLLFPPFVKLLALHGIFVLFPGLAHVFAIGNIIIGSLAYLGAKSHLRNILIVVSISFLSLYALFCEPLFSVPFLAATFLLLCPAVATIDFSKTKLIWLCLAAITASGMFFSLDGYAFLKGCFQYPARAIFTNEIYGEIQTGAYASLPFQTFRTLVIFVVCLYGSVLGYRYAERTIRPLFVAVCLHMIVMLGLSIVFVFGEVNWVNPLPVYLEMSSYAFYIIAAVHGICALIHSKQPFLKVNCRVLCEQLSTVSKHRLYPYVIAGIVPLGILVLFLTAVGARRTYNPANHPPDDLVEDAIQSPIIDQLVSAIRIVPGSAFRGSVVSLFGVSGGPLAKTLGYQDDVPYDKWIMTAARDQLSKEYGNSHMLDDLWRFGIPTLEEYSPLLSPFFYITVSRFLSRPQDYQSRNYAVVTKPDIKILAALGVRFVLTDMNIKDNRIVLRMELPTKGDSSVRLYELVSPNLATFSPTRVYKASTALESVSLIQSETFNPERDVVLYENSRWPFVPVKSSQMIFERGGIRLLASAEGRSLLLLPLQFSHCFSNRSTSAQQCSQAMVVRANISQTAVIFERDLNIVLSFKFGLNSGAGRVQDLDDVERLQLKQMSGRVHLPSGLHPYSIRMLSNTSKYGNKN